MADSSITKTQFSKLIDDLMKECAVYGPKVEKDIVAFRRLGSSDELLLGYRNSTVSPKELFLPRTECVYEFDGQEFVDKAEQEKKRAILGMRPCDCRALTLLDRVFDTDQVKDPFYLARRNNSLVIAMACDRPLSTCFCTAVGGDPFGEDGADVLMGEVDGSFIAKGLTPKGNDFLAQYGRFFSNKGPADWKEQAKHARRKLKTDLELGGAEARLRELFEHEVWETVSRKCQGCGTCSYLCPTCYCFDLTDEKTAGGARKFRSWDCCMFPLFTLHVSGHNPRSVNAARMRQKIMHKFSYYPEVYDVNGCVGCGRCVRSCPVNLDIRQLLGEVMCVTAGASAS